MKKSKLALLLALSGGLILAACASGQGEEGSSLPAESSSSVDETVLVPEDVTNRVNDLLGCYQELEYSPLPYIDGATYSLDEDDEETIYISGVSEEGFEAYVASLLKSGFTEKGDGYLDPLGRYIASFPESEGVRTLEISFNDEAGEFPVNFISTCTSAIDILSYMDPSTFMGAENDPTQDPADKFLTTTRRVVSGGSVYSSKYVCYTPKASDDSPLATLDDWLEDNGYARVSSSYYIYADSFYSCLAYSGIVGDGSFALRAAGAEVGDVYIQFVHSWTEELNTEDIETYYEELTGYEYPSEAFPDWTKLGKAHGITLTYSYSSYYGPGWIIADADKTAFQAVLDELYDGGWSYTQTNISYATLFNFFGPKNEYRIYLSYYDHNKIGGLFSDICQIRLFGFPSLYEGMGSWFKRNNVGGGEVSDIPELPCVGLKGTNGVDSYANPYYSLTGRDMSEEGYAKYVAALEDDGWALDEDAGSDSLDVYVSECGFYSLYLSYDGSDLSVSATLYYDAYHYSSALTYSELMGYGALRFSVSSLDIPTLESELNVTPLKELMVMSLFYSYQRFMIYVPYDTEDAVDTALEAYLTAIAADGSGWTYVGKNSYYSFYQNADGVYAYSGSSISTSGNYWVIGLYIDN